MINRAWAFGIALDIPLLYANRGLVGAGRQAKKNPLGTHLTGTIEIIDCTALHQKTSADFVN